MLKPLSRSYVNYRRNVTITLAITLAITFALWVVYMFWEFPFNSPVELSFPFTGLNISLMTFYLFTVIQLIGYGAGLKITPLIFGTINMLICAYLMMLLSWYTYSISYANSVGNVGSFYDCTTAFIITYLFTFTGVISFLLEIYFFIKDRVKKPRKVV